jgi:cytochrome P450
MSVADPRDLAEHARLDDPAFYLDDPYPMYQRMRAEAPVFWYTPRDVWALSRYHDIRSVLRQGQLWISSPGTFLHDANRRSEVAVAGSMFGEGGEQLSVTDPPRHTELRRVSAATFNPRWLARLTPAIEGFCDQLLDQIVPGEPFDFVKAVAEKLPIHTACALLGLPGDNVEDIIRWSDELEYAVSTDLPPEQLAATSSDFFDSIVGYVREQLAFKRTHPGDDFLSALLSAELDNDKLSEANVLMFAITAIAAGNDTTRALLSGTVSTLAAYPDQLATLAANRELVGPAIEEVLRWVTPGGRGFLRTATGDTEIRNQPIRAGEHVYLMYDAANRDEDAFEAADVFDITRPRANPHLAFGFSAHGCLGAPLVRIEVKLFLNRLLDRFPRWRVVGPGRRTETVLRNGWHELPVVFET